MKKIFYILIIAISGNLLYSCDDFLTRTPSTSVTEEEAFETASDFENAMHGVYYNLGTYRFLGRDVLAIGEAPSDVTTHSAATTHFLNIFNYQILATNLYLSEIWEYGYKAIAGSSRIIEAGENLPEDFPAYDVPIVETQLAQAYALRALTTFYLTNIFGLPYSDANKSTLGVVNVTKPVKPFENVARATLEENYTHILTDIAKAKEYFGKDGVEALSYAYMNETALYAFEARVKLYLKDYDGAIEAANTAISLRQGVIVSTPDGYRNMYRSLAASSEDIFYIAKSEDNYLSANSYNTLFNNYGLAVSGDVKAEFAANDIRLALIEGRGGKMAGIYTNDQVSNLPVFRLPEQYLILAEAYALKQTPDYTEAIKNLLEVASKRNGLDESNIPETADILDLILNERKLELLQEGHRYFDLRRLRLKATVSDGRYSDFEIYDFVYPVPVSEVNAGFGVIQTEGWSNNLPKTQ
ncbi:MAG: RagB/SusD family nutrient uptake outer membrane protein [Prevotellaceae bacterium]|jgi:hypothetical protein|nr:RagB/SusD family nutrient uptake outer membrane protein [Prevotellaceae bacterium]